MLQEYEFSDKLMGCDLDVSIILDSRPEAEKIFQEILKFGKKYESIFSRFLEDSELSILNKEGRLRVSEIFWEAFSESESLYKKSSGRYNPSLDISRMGYDESFYFIKAKIKVERSAVNINFKNITKDISKREIILGENQSLDFGGFLKGYVAEKMSRIYNLPGIIINLGGDIYTRGRDESGYKFSFEIWDPINKKGLMDIELEDAGISTSGNYKRRWKLANREVHHILDSKTGVNPKNDLVSATVISDSGSESDAFATVLMTMGSEKAKEFIKRRNLKAVLIKTDGESLKINF